MIKLYVLDTSVIISNPYCLDSFPNENVIIQVSVLRELDSIKTHSGDPGRNARIFIRLLDELSDKGDISQGVKTDKNTTIRIDTDHYDASQFGDPSYSDNKILSCALHLKQNHNVIIVSSDIEMRVVAKAFGMGAQGYSDNKSDINELYSGSRALCDADLGNRLKKNRMILQKIKILI